MATHFFTPVLGKRLRVTELDNCGRVGESANSLTTDGFITITLSSETEAGVEILQKNASGGLCVNERFNDSFKRFTVEVEFCGVNPSLLGIVSNAEPYEDYAGDVAGFTVPEGTIDKWFALELWTGLSGVACAPGEEDASGYLLLPFVASGVLGDITVDGENAVTFSMTGAYTKGQNGWGTGPFDVVNATAADVAEQWEALTAYGLGDLVFDDIYYYRATEAGTSDSTEPTPPGVGSTVVDGTVTWEEIDSTTAVPARLPDALDPLDHLLLIDTGLAAPPSSVDPVPVPGA